MLRQLMLRQLSCAQAVLRYRTCPSSACLILACSAASAARWPTCSILPLWSFRAWVVVVGVVAR